MLTICTATYNRAHLLPRLYTSLCNQSLCDFEWIVVDDGSTDFTEHLISSYINQSKFRIRYYKIENGGKCRAINYGVTKAQGNWFLIVDSDDFLATGSVVYNIFDAVAQIENTEGVCALVGNKIDTSGFVIGSCANYDILDSDFISYREKYSIHGDRAEVVKTDIMKEFPFPEFRGEKFMAEGVVWNRMALKYTARFVNINFISCEYQEDGLSASIKKCRKNNPKAFLLYYSEYCSLFTKALFINRVKRSIAYWCVYFTSKECVKSRRFMMNNYFYTLPIGWLISKMNKL